MKTKKCGKCKKVKSIENFLKKDPKIKPYCYCKECRRNYYISNSEKYIENTKKWQKENPKRTKELNKLNSRKKDKSPQGRAISMSRRMVAELIENKSNTYSLILGCTGAQFVGWIESKLEEGMTWENRGSKGWHLDHIIPTNRFDLTNIEERRIWSHYLNVQPLWANDNYSKRSILPENIDERITEIKKAIKEKTPPIF